MTRITCLIPPHRLEGVKSAIASAGANGLTVTDVRGVGNSIESSTLFGGEEGVIPLPLRSKIEVVVIDEDVERIVGAILRVAQTGEPGDGKIFLEPVIDAHRIRTGEHGDMAL